MIKYSIILFTFVSSVTCSFCQENDDSTNLDPSKITVSIEDIVNDIDDLNILRFRVPIYEFTIAKYNTALLNLSTGVFYQLGNKFNFNIDYSYALGDRLFPETTEKDREIKDPNMFSVNKYSPANYFTTGVTYFFSEKKVEKLLRINVTGIKKKKLIIYTLVNGLELKRIGVHAGLTRGVTWYNMNNKTLNAQSLDNPSEPMREFNLKSQSTWFSYTNLHLGLTFSKLNNLFVNCVGFGKRRNSSFSSLTFDLLYSINNRLDDVYVATDYIEPTNFQIVNGTYYYGKFNINDFNKKLNLGFSMTYKSFGLDSFASPIFEIGYMPGLKSVLNLYTKIGITLYVGKKQ